MPRLPRWRIDLFRGLLLSLGGACALWIAGWPHKGATVAWTGAIGAVCGLLLAFALEWIWRLRCEVVRLHDAQRDRDSERAQRQELDRLMSHQLAVARREAQINAVHMKIYADAFAEVGGGQRIPASAMLARVEVMMKAQNLDMPITIDRQ